MELRRGDNDKKSIWGGVKADQVPEHTVMSLQSRLQNVGVYTDSLDGIFGGKTENAVMLFQWCMKNSVRVGKEKASLNFNPSTSVELTGVCDSVTLSMLGTWVENQFTATGDLVRLSADELSNIQLSQTFKPIGHPVVEKNEFVVSRAIIPMIELMNKTARELDLLISVNQTLRLHGSEVTGHVVPPARKSQHYIGHAIDCNIRDGESWNTSNDFKSNRQTDNANKFVKTMRGARYRWGGDFTPVDPPHFDSQLDARSFDYDAKYFLNQKQIASGEPIEKLFID